MISKTPLFKKAHVWCNGTFEINIQYSNECERNLLKFGADSCINKYLSPWKFIVWTELQRKKNVISVK